MLAVEPIEITDLHDIVRIQQLINIGAKPRIASNVLSFAIEHSYLRVRSLDLHLFKTIIASSVVDDVAGMTSPHKRRPETYFLQIVCIST